MADETDHVVAGLPARLERDTGPCGSRSSDRLLWRKEPLRLEAETIRDSMLALSSLLNEEMFGKQEPIKRGADGQWMPNDKNGEGQNRRSLYVAQTRARSGQLFTRVRLSGHD
jgi:hypothetical protein